MERRSFIGCAALGALSAAIPRALAAQTGEWSEHVRPSMGTFVNIAVHAESKTRARELADDCFAYLERCVMQISNWDGNSQTCRANEQKFLNAEPSTESVISLARQARRIQSLSAGRFNASILSLTKLWRDAKAGSTVPAALDIRHCMNEVHSSHFSVDRSGLELFGNSGLEFDGIGKGLIADLGVEYLRQRGVRFARIACSGDIRFLGDTEWCVDIEDPRREKILGTLKVRGDVAVASSGDYRNCWFVNGRRYHHLINPTTGYPGSECWQTTVVARSCVVADALAVAAFFLPPEKGLKMVNFEPGAAAVIVSSAGKVFLSQGVTFSQAFSLT